MRSNAVFKYAIIGYYIGYVKNLKVFTELYWFIKQLEHNIIFQPVL